MPIFFGNRIRAARKAVGFTQRQLADKINVSNTSVSNWEHNLSRPDPDTIQNLCWALNVQPNYFFAGNTQEVSLKNTSTKAAPCDRNTLRLTGRNGLFIEKVLTDEQMNTFETLISGLPDASDNL